VPHVDEGRLTAWLDGALGPGDPAGAEVARHLEACADCRHRLEEARELRERAAAILAEADVPAGPAPGFERIAARARGGAPAHRSRRSRRRRSVPATGLAWAASVALAVTAGWLARDLSLRRGDALPPFAGAPAAEEASRADREVAEERPENRAEEQRMRVEDAATPPARQRSEAGPEGKAVPSERGEGEETREAGKARASRAEPAPAPAALAAIAGDADPFHAPPDPEAAGVAGAPDAAGCWEREIAARGLPARIRLEPGTGVVTDAGGRIVARWTGFAADSVWIGGAGPETLRLHLEGDRLTGRSRLRPGEDAAMAAEAKAGGGAGPVPAVLRRVPCEP